MLIKNREVLKKRRHFGPKQVRTANSLKRGNVFMLITKGCKIRIVILNPPFCAYDRNFRFFVEYMYLDGDRSGDWVTSSLCDLNIFPYIEDDGYYWHKHNRLLRTGSTRLTYMEVRDLVSLL